MDDRDFRNEICLVLRRDFAGLVMDVGRGRRTGEDVVTLVGELRGERIVTLPPSESSPILARVADSLTAAGFDCTSSRTRVSVFRAGERPVLGAPDFICRDSGGRES